MPRRSSSSVPPQRVYNSQYAECCSEVMILASVSGEREYLAVYRRFGANVDVPEYKLVEG